MPFSSTWTCWVTPLRLSSSPSGILPLCHVVWSKSWSCSVTSSLNCRFTVTARGATPGRKRFFKTGVIPSKSKRFSDYGVAAKAWEDPWRHSAPKASVPLRATGNHKQKLQKVRKSITPSPMGKRNLKVAVIGCAHGELDGIYAAIRETEEKSGIKVDVVLCAGDFQAVRNRADMESLACPPKYRDMRSFWKYYNGTLHAPIPTFFIGGNHEASNHLQEIPLGGLVAPNIYFLGYAGVVNFRGLRLAGVSGTYVEHGYRRKRTERPPYAGSSIRSVYHMREEDVNRILRLSPKRNDAGSSPIGRTNGVDVMLSHDWPRGITDYGDLQALLKAKPFLRTEIAEGSFGNAPMMQVLRSLRPTYWFSAHMHVKFPAIVSHQSSNSSETCTKFLALDKVLPRRDFLQILDIQVDCETDQHDQPQLEEGEHPVHLDLEWLTVLRTEAENKNGNRTTAVTQEEMKITREILASHHIPLSVLMKSDFLPTADSHSETAVVPRPQSKTLSPFQIQKNNTRLFKALGLLAPPDYLFLADDTQDDSQPTQGTARTTTTVKKEGSPPPTTLLHEGDELDILKT